MYEQPNSTAPRSRAFARWVKMWAEQSIWFSFVRTARLDKEYAFYQHERGNHKRCYHK